MSQNTLLHCFSRETLDCGVSIFSQELYNMSARDAYKIN